MTLTLTKKELSSLTGYSYRRLHDIDMALPANEKLFVGTADGKYDAPLFVQRWVKYNVNSEMSDDSTLDEAKTIHERVKTRKTELEVARLEGSLVDVQEVAKLWATIANTVKQNLLRLPYKAAPQIVMMGSVENITAILDTEVREILTDIADTPVPEEEAEDADADAEEEEDGESE